ncbi:HLA class II histocompatibility antigen gamma chain [Pelobates fuscus]|uniref:HLA class II histocompatibility antigen gamma chain n=1 Tax=Pelobates fuscus TaxID=191477 RepID=UPI002FE49364
MDEDSQNLVGNQVLDDSVISVDNRVPRNTMSCNKQSLVTALSVFVALLIVGQAVTVYFLTQQQDKINTLDLTTKHLKLQDMIKKLPGSPSSASKSKLKMASIDIPLMVRDPNQPIPISTQALKGLAEASNMVEDAVHYILRKGKPFRYFPSFNGTVLDNMKELRKNLGDEEWMVFSSWMEQWFLFYLVQNTKAPKTTPTPRENLFTGAPVMSECQLRASGRTQPGTFQPQCDENGDYESQQCWRATGYCWCVYKNGTEVPETRSRAKLDCSKFNLFDESNIGSTALNYYENE